MISKIYFNLKLHICSEEASSTCSFDTKKYYARLATRCLGRNVLFVPVTTTTIDVCRRYGSHTMRYGRGKEGYVRGGGYSMDVR